MENAAKALQIAGAILIGIMILSVAVFLFASSSRLGDSIYGKIDENETKKFNEQFLKYNGLENCTVHDIISVTNLAKNNNLRYDLNKQNANKNSYYITINLRTKNEQFNNLEDMSEETYIDLLNDSVTTGLGTLNNSKAQFRKFKCVVEISEVTKRVYKLTFNEV